MTGGWRRGLRERAIVLALALRVEVGLVRVDAGRLTLAELCSGLGFRFDVDSPPQTGAPQAASGGEQALLPGWARVSVEAIDAVLRRWPRGDTCLRRCLVLGHRLRGLEPALRIGGRRDRDGGWHAHSWLEVGGRSVESGSAAYSALRR